MKGKKLTKIFLAVAMTLCLMPNQVHAAETDLTANSEGAISSINLPRWENGSKVGQEVSDYLKAKLDTSTLKLTEAEEKYKVDFQIKDLYLASDYLNGVSPAGISFYNMLNLYIDLYQLDTIMEENNIDIVLDSKNKEVSEDYVKKMLDLVTQIIVIDPRTKLVYDYNSAHDTQYFKENKNVGGTDVIATHRSDDSVTFKFHIDSHGWWGYDLGAHDSITGLVMGLSDKDAYDKQREYTSKYGNFFVIDMNKGNGNWYMLNGTDLENPIIYLSDDGKEALMIDVDMYGKNVLNHVIKTVIGDECKTLNVFFTHNHGDHVENLEVMMSDSDLKDIIKVYWPKNEPTTATIKKFLEVADASRFEEVSDYETFEIGGFEFKFNEILNEHTPGGGQLADLTNKILFSGDTLGAQVHLGGTTVSTSSLENWYNGMVKTEEFIKDNGLKYVIGGHTPYLNTTDFATWVKTAIEYAQEKFTENKYWAGGLVIVENGKIVTGDRMSEMFSKGVTDREELNIASVNFRNDLYSKVNGNYEKAISEVIVPKYDEKGNKIEQKVSDLLKAKLDNSNLEAYKDNKSKTIKIDVQLKDLYLSSDYLNGASPAGISYYNMMNYYTDVKQIKQILDSRSQDYKVIDLVGNEVDYDYIVELLGLLDQINDLDPTTNLKYDYSSAYDTKNFAANTKVGGTDVIATSKEGNVTFKFHIDSHGWWGYDLGADDSITSLVMGYDQEAIDKDRAEWESPITKQYGNFFVIEMENKAKGKWYMLNGIDLENPIVYVSEDGKEAFMIDVDMYGKNVLPYVIKSVIGEKCESLKVFMTHNHPDHVNNLEIMMKDEDLKDIISVYWPENEPIVEIVEKAIDVNDKIKFVKVKDSEVFEACGVKFKFNEIKDEHTPGGGQLADLTNGILFSGDTLGAQVHLGGTTVMSNSVNQWIDGMVKTEKFIKDNGLKYIIGGHTPYLNTTEFATWVKIALEYAKDQMAADKEWKGGLIIVENGNVVTGERMGEIFTAGLTDREELNVASVNFRVVADQTQNPEVPENPEKPKDPVVTPDNSSNTPEKNPAKTGDNTNIAVWVTVATLALGGVIIAIKKSKKEDEV